jgi:transposase
MIAVPAGMRVTKPVVFRRGAGSLAALVREQLRHDPFSGTIYIFRSKRADRLKILAWDGSAGVVLEAAGAGSLPLAADQRTSATSCAAVSRITPSTEWTGRGCTLTTLRGRRRRRDRRDVLNHLCMA